MEEDEDELLQQAMLMSMQPLSENKTEEPKIETKEEKPIEKQGDAPSYEDLMKMLELSVNEEMLQELISIDISKLRALKARKKKIHLIIFKSTVLTVNQLKLQSNGKTIQNSHQGLLYIKMMLTLTTQLNSKMKVHKNKQKESKFKQKTQNLTWNKRKKKKLNVKNKKQKKKKEEEEKLERNQQ
jgi:hypothetical protein